MLAPMGNFPNLEPIRCDPDVVLVDTRNYYEYAIGTFKNAINPTLPLFAISLITLPNTLNPNQHKKSRYVCTGIRCEKIHRLPKTTRF